MNNMPEALRLAAQLEDPVNAKLYLAPYIAAELRRLHEVNQAMQTALQFIANNSVDGGTFNKTARDALKVNITDLSGIALDWAVANGEGLLAFGYKNDSGRLLITLSSCNTEYFQPTLHWSLAGPIIEREGIATRKSFEDGRGGWTANIWAHGTTFFEEGPTPLIAAMRCFVASKFGESIEIPDELTQV